MTNNTTLDLSDRSHNEDRSSHDNRIIVAPPAGATPQGGLAPRPTPDPVELRPQVTPSSRAIVPNKSPQFSLPPPARTSAPQPRQQEAEEAVDGELTALYRRLHDLKEEGYRIARNLPDDLGGRERQYLAWKEKALVTLRRLDSHLRSQYKLDTHVRGSLHVQPAGRANLLRKTITRTQTAYVYTGPCAATAGRLRRQQPSAGTAPTVSACTEAGRVHITEAWLSGSESVVREGQTPARNIFSESVIFCRTRECGTRAS